MRIISINIVTAKVFKKDVGNPQLIIIIKPKLMLLREAFVK